MTKVEEWTRAEIGVGAAIAAGSQEEKGNWALLEIAATIRRTITILGNSSLEIKFQLNFIVKILIEIKMAISPRRLEKIVIIPEEADEKFW